MENDMKKLDSIYKSYKNKTSATNKLYQEFIYELNENKNLYYEGLLSKKVFVKHSCHQIKKFKERLNG
jgi:hypothetical protein